MYDIIGDIHGYAEPLRQLLSKLGYQSRDGVWRHPERKVLFLGDFVDRGPEQVEVVQLARSMVEAGHALAIMGNHEFNAVAFATPDPQNPGQCLRPHTEKNRRQHQSFLDQVVEGSALHSEIIDWFRTLPVYLELPEFRAVHACWHPQQLEAIKPALDEAGRLKSDSWACASEKGHPVYEAVETLLKGLEIPLPEGVIFHDKDSNPRSNIRTQWWLQGQYTYRDLAIVPPEVIERIPHQPVPGDILPGYDNHKPVFVGHYWLTGTPEPLAENIACLDYSVVNDAHGKLAAYRWDGELLSKEGYIWVERSPQKVQKADPFSPQTILYIHGYGSSVDQSMQHPKYKALSQLGKVVAIAPDYNRSPHESVAEALSAISENEIDLIVGTSMGGWLASKVGPRTGTPYVALNPAIQPSQSLLKYPEAKGVARQYDDFEPEGCCHIFVELGDEVLDPKATVAFIAEKRPVTLIEGDSHRFENLNNIIPDIEALYTDSQLVYGLEND